MMRLTMVCFVFAAVSCQSGVSIETDRSSYPLVMSGVDVELLLKNHSQAEFVSPLCGAVLQKRVQSVWTVVPTAGPFVCVASSQRVSPNREVSRTMLIDSAVGAGTYRFVVTVDPELGSTEDVPSAPFELLGSTDIVP